MNAVGRLVRRVHLELGGAYLRVAAVGGAAAIPFLVVWPVSTVIVVALVAAVAPVLDRRRRAAAVRSGRPPAPGQCAAARSGASASARTDAAS